MRLGFAYSAVALMLLLPLAGCIGMDTKLNITGEDEDETVPALNLSAELDFRDMELQWSEPAVFTGTLDGWQDGLNASLDLLDVKRDHQDAEVEGYLLKVEESGAFRIIIEFSAPGNWTFIPRLTVSANHSLYLLQASVKVA